MSRDIVWIPKTVVLRVHKEQLMIHGGGDGFLNEGHLDAALGRPRTAVGYAPEMSIEELAACMAVGLAKSHPFVDGNKRTACVVSLMFLELNGVTINTTDDELAGVFEDVAAGKLSEARLAQWFMENTVSPEY